MDNLKIRNKMKHLNFILVGLFSVRSCCRAQVLPLEEKCGAEHQGRTNQRKTAFARWGENLSGGAYYSRLRTYGYDGNSAHWQFEE